MSLDPDPSQPELSADLSATPETAASAEQAVGRLWLGCALLMIAVSVFFRFWRLSNVPGLNGDEAWYGANAMAVIHDGPVQWKTPNGNFINPFYFLPLLALQSILPPSIALLRVTAAIYGIGALIANWALCRRVFGARTALASTLILAILPEDIAQSRLGWDPCQSLLIDCIGLYLSLMVVLEQDLRRAGKRMIWAFLALIAALVIHPGNIFLALFLLVAAVARFGEQIAPWVDPRRPGLRWLGCYIAIAVAMVLVGEWKRDWLDAGLDRLLHTNSAAVFPLFYLRLFNGITAYRYLAGSWTPEATGEKSILAVSILTAFAFIPVICAVVHSFGRKKPLATVDRALFLGWLTVFIVFLLIGGAEALIPGNDRLSLVLIPMGVVAIARSSELMAGENKDLQGLFTTLSVVLGAAMLVGFYRGYFQFIETTGGQSEATLRAGPVDPKQAAFDYIQSERDDRSDVTMILTSTWWTYQPLRYFAGGDDRLWVLTPDLLTGPTLQAEVSETRDAGRLWFVDFVGSAAQEGAEQGLKDRKTPYTEKTFDDYAGRPVVNVIHVLPANSQIGPPPAQ